MKTLLLAAIINSLSYAVATLLNLTDQGVDIVPLRQGGSRRAIYLIGGCQCRTTKPFKFILDKLPNGVAVYLVEYRNDGFDIDRAADDILIHIRANKYNVVTFVAVSMGYQLAALCRGKNDKIIALNPCIGEVSLRTRIKIAMSMMPLLYLLVIILGWFSRLPLVKIDGRPYYSLQLLLNQFEVCADNAILDQCGLYPDVLILSQYDSIINNDALLENLDKTPQIYWLNTEHFGLVDNGSLFRAAVVDNLL